MKAHVDHEAGFALLDALLARWKAKQFPYNKKDALIPQRLIPPLLRMDLQTLANFYFFLCIYMRGGIESAQAFRALIALWHDDPLLFDPLHVQWLSPRYMQDVLQEYIGWDSKAASVNWIENARRLCATWRGNPLNLVKNLQSYDEALRRIRNKLTKRDRLAAGNDGLGFRGFQPKMVSMLLYFYDWEGWLKPRFLYPAPADFHNFRLGFNQGIITLDTNATDISFDEDVSRPWRSMLMAYLRARAADPIEVADAVWLFSLTMCGNSPLMAVLDGETNGSGMFTHEELPHLTNGEFHAAPRFQRALELTCLRCPLLQNCRYAIPSKPYYRKGRFQLNPRFPIEKYLDTIDADVPIPENERFNNEAEPALRVLI